MNIVKMTARIAALAIGVAGIASLAPPVASAQPVTYQFDAGSSISFYTCFASMEPCSTVTEDVSGTFAYDTSDSTLSAVNVALTGSGVESGSYTEPVSNPVGPSVVPVADPTLGYIAFDFSAALSGVSDNLDTSVNGQEFCAFCGSGGQLYSATATGGVVALPATVPEPPSAAILATALGLFLVGRRALRRTPRAR